MWFLLTAILISSLLAARAFLVTLGAIKDPILQSFEVFGEERHYYPTLWLTVWTCLTLYLALFLYFPAGQVILFGSIIGLFISGFSEPLRRLRDRYDTFLKNFPQWYQTLVERTDREERRRIAYHWLRLPARTRWLYNARTEFFWQWIDQVLITIG
jgi:hypothetical protein